MNAIDLLCKHIIKGGGGGEDTECKYKENCVNYHDNLH